MADDTDDIPDLLGRLREAIRSRLGVTGQRVEVYTVEMPDRPIPLLFPPPARNGARPVPEPNDEPAAKLTPTERRILRAAANLEAEDPTGQDLAAAAKLPYEAHFRRLLSSLRDRGYFGGDKRDPGYPITPAGLDVITPENGL